MVMVKKRDPESCTEIIDRSFVQVKYGDEPKLRRKSQFIPLYVASFSLIATSSLVEITMVCLSSAPIVTSTKI